MLGRSDRGRGIGAGLAAAALFGVSAPLTTELLDGTGTLAIAGLLYAGAGVALTVARTGGRRGAQPATRRSDRRLLAGLVVLGGMVGPVLLVTGLRRLSPELSALLLNLEAPATIALGVLFFGDHLGRTGTMAATATVAGGVVLTMTSPAGVDVVGVLAVAGACLAWGLDNNLSQRLALVDPVRVGQVKAVGAAVPLLVLAAARGEPFPDPSGTVALLGIGTAAYGLSIVLDLVALRHLGAAREASVFATGPFLGAGFAVVVLDQPVTTGLLVAGCLMALGLVLLALEAHDHAHEHPELVHEHRHRHDDGEHDHPHTRPAPGPHSHRHRHPVHRHAHRHMPDPHHRHPH